MFRLKPDYEQVLDRFEAWWRCEILDRPSVSLTLPVSESERVPEPVSSHATLEDRWMDTEYQVRAAATRLENTRFLGDSLPIAYPNLGPEIFASFYGCKIGFGETTAWTEPILEDLSEASVNSLQMDVSSRYYRKIFEMTDAFIETGKGNFIVGYTDLHGGGDAIAAFRDPQNLLIDTLEEPEAIKTVCERITGDFLTVYDTFHERLSGAGMPSTTWLPVVGKGRVHVPSNDFSCMISEEAFEDLFIPGIQRECRHMDRCIYHLDGPQALRYLDRLLDLPEIHAIQWVPGAGQEYWADWIHVYQRIQEKGKAMQILEVPVDDLPLLFSSLNPEGVWVSSISGISSEPEAEDVIKAFAGWTRRL